MVAVPEIGVSAPVVVTGAGRDGVPTRHRRAVAVAPSATELLRPESDLARLLGSFTEVDLLLAAEVEVVGTPGSVSALGSVTGEFGPWSVDDADEDEPDEVRSEVAALGLPDLALHRLGLSTVAGPGAEGDIVAALSELVGFDPEPGVYCLAPAPWPSDPVRSTVGRAAERIAQVYGIPLLRYRCLELTVVGR